MLQITDSTSPQGISGKSNCRVAKLINQLISDTAEANAARITHIALSDIMAISIDDTEKHLHSYLSLSDALRRLGYYNHSQSIIAKISSLPLPIQHSSNYELLHELPSSDTSSYENSIISLEPTRFNGISIADLVNLAAYASDNEELASDFLDEIGGMSNASTYLMFSNICEDYPREQKQAEALVADDETSEAENLNLDFINNRRQTLWDRVLHAKNVGIATAKDGRLARLIPVGSALVDRNCGGILAHLYVSGKTIIAPLYTGWVSAIEGLIIISPKLKRSLALVNSKTTLPKAIESHLDGVVSSALLASTTLQGKISSSNQQIRKFLLIGQRINFGHSIINDINSLSVLSRKSKTDDYGLALGNWDFVSTVELLKTLQPNLFGNFSSIITLNDSDDRSHDIYVFNNKLLFPIPSFRPPLEALRSIWDFPYACSDSSACKQNGTAAGAESALYISIDERKGSRNFVNKMEVVESIAKLCLHRGISTLILDGLTAIPKYSVTSRNMVRSSLISASLSSSIHDDFNALCSTYQIRSVILDGLSFLEKLRYLSNYKVVCALAPYGSSMIFPIYIINCPIGIFGHEHYSHILKAWQWHVTRFCHPLRSEREVYVNSISHGNTGYVVDTNEVNRFISGLLDA